MASIKKDKKTGTWYFRVSYKDKEGKYRTKTRKGFKTKLEAQVEAGKLENKKNEIQDLSNDKDLTVFSTYFEEWVHTYILGRYSASTDRRYKNEIVRVKEYFKLTPISKITRMQYQTFLNERGENVGRDALKKTHEVVKKCLSYAIADGLIKQDPTFGAVLKWGVQTRKPINYLSFRESVLLRNYLIEHFNPIHFMLLISLETGLRIGEVCGLSYQDFTADTLSVNRGYDYRLTHDFTPGKTKSSIRTISITPTLVNLMKRHQLANQKNNETYLFLNHKNKPLFSYSYLYTYFKSLCLELSIQQIGIHGLRHTHASVLIYKQLNINYISKRLGHAKINETLQTYAHILDELEQQQNEAVLNIYEMEAQ